MHCVADLKQTFNLYELPYEHFGTYLQRRHGTVLDMSKCGVMACTDRRFCLKLLTLVSENCKKEEILILNGYYESTEHYN